MTITPKYLTTTQAAAYCGVSKKTLEHYRQNGTGPQYIKRRGILRYTVEFLDAWMQAGVVRTIDPANS
ncbi:helix-turn-helix domain-containing protein [Desulfovibrio sp. OttesenSCG-928-G11]|nr:helix-turn-helix domain-containing protein [Desulfovibrio sp. OttesenSCG-928-G11]